MQISQEMVFHPAMGIGLTAGRLPTIINTADLVETKRPDTDRRYRCQDRRRRTQDCVHIFQCA